MPNEDEVRNVFLRILLCLLFQAFLTAGGASGADVVSGEAAGGDSDAPPTATGEGNRTTRDAVLSPGDENATHSPENHGDTVYRLETLRVVADRVELGEATVDGQALQSMPSRSGSVTEALKVVPGVQFSNEEPSSFTAGEIRPPRVSIAGAKPYENNFLIDGTSVSNSLNPIGLSAEGDSFGPGRLDVSGADQTIFYDTSLLDSVTVFTSNVPAKYGSFVGGVVDADLKDPRKDRWHGTLSGQHTRSEWFDLRGVDDESTSSDNQPRFKTYVLQGAVDGPVSENMAVLLSSTRRWSVIPLLFEENDGSEHVKDQFRKNENFFAKMLVTPSRDLELRLDATYAPYVEERWRSGWPDSDWDLENKAWRLAGEAAYLAGWGKLTGKLVYSRNGYGRDSAVNEREQLSGTGVPDDEEYFRGGLGDARVTNQGVDFGLDLEFDEVRSGVLGWEVSTGLDLTTVTTEMWNEDAVVRTMTIPTNGNWLRLEAVYPESDQTETLNTIGYYLQTKMLLGRFTLVPGLRLDHDDYSQNMDVAHRLKGEFDVFGDGRLRLVSGVNRYYGGQLRAYAFDRWRPYEMKRESWNSKKKVLTVTYTEDDDISYQAKGLDTPYSDELMGGVLGDAAGFTYGLELVHRDHRDQIISKLSDDSEDEEDVYELTNDGKSTYDGITFTLSRAFETQRFGTHILAFGATESRTKTFNGAFYSDVNVNDLSNGYEYDYDQVYFDGELIDRNEMPAEDFNAPLVLTASWLGSFWDDRFRVNCVSRWRDSTTGIRPDKRSADETPYGTTAPKTTTESAEWIGPEGKYHDAYMEGVISGGLVTDVSLEFDAVKESMFTLSLLLDVFNVFSSDGHVGVSELDGGGHTLPRSQYGRAYYAGVRCEF